MRITEQRLHQVGVIWTYLKSQSSIENILQQCSSAAGKFESYGVLPLTIHVDLMRLGEMDSRVTNVMVHNPQEGTMLFREVVRQLLIVYGWLPDHDSSLRNLVITLRVDAATLPDLRWACNQRGHYKGLVRLTGVVLGITATVTYTKSTRYRCPKEGCEGYSGDQYIRVHVPGASEQDTVGHKFICSVCSTGLKEIKSSREISDKLLAEIMTLSGDDGQTHDMWTGIHRQTVPVIVRDELCSNVKLGRQYNIIGTRRVKMEAENISRVFEVNNITLVKTSLSVDDSTSRLSPRVHGLYMVWKNYPLVFPHLMALRFADTVCPANCFFKLKLLLLISLVLTEETPALHLLFVSTEIQLVERLLQWAGRLVKRCVSVSPMHVPLGLKVTPSPYPWAPYFVHAGSLVQSAGGICRVGDVRLLKKADKLELQSALTENRVQVTLDARYTSGLPAVLSAPLSCSVWGLLTGGADLGTGDVAFGASAGVSDVTPVLLDAFSYVCSCDGSLASSVDVTHDLASHILAASGVEQGIQAMEGNSGLSPLSPFEPSPHASNDDGKSLSLEDFRQYVQACRSHRTTMTVEAEYLLTSYLVTTRQARANRSLSAPSTLVPMNAWNTLQALAHGLCRLSLRDCVQEEDAVRAVWLYEESLADRHGISILNVYPEPHLPADSAENYITAQLAADMTHFHSRLMVFCNTGCGMASATEE